MASNTPGRVRPWRIRGEAPATFLLERDGELGRLERAIGAAAGGAGGVVAVEGEAGIGKSRLLAAGRELAEAAGLRVLTARGSEFERAHGYGIVRQLLEPPLARADAAARGALLAGPARAAGGLLGEAGAPELGPDCEDAAFASLHALYWLTVNLAEREPLALVVDDAQWADAISLRWLGYLARRIEGLPAVILLAVRTGAPLEVELADLLAAPDEVLRPRRLSADAGRALARELTGAEVAPEFSAAVHEATGGNPLLLRELVSALAEEGVAPDAAGARRAREVAPEAVTRAVSLRLARLPERVQSVAVAVAVLGDNAGANCVAHFTGLEREEAARAVAELAAAGILRPGWPAGFAHPVLGAAVYERLSEPERQRLHARAAEVLELVGAPEHAVAAQQLRTPPAGRAEAVAVLRRAAERARAAGDPEEALTYLRRALQEPPAPEALPELLVELGECERRAGAPEALDRLRRAHELLEDPDRRAHVAYVIGRSLMWSGRNADAVPWIETAIADLPAGDPARARRYEAELISAMLREPATRREATRRLAAIAYDSLGTDVGTRMLLACRAWVATSRGEDLALRGRLRGPRAGRRHRAPRRRLLGLLERRLRARVRRRPRRRVPGLGRRARPRPRHRRPGRLRARVVVLRLHRADAGSARGLRGAPAVGARRARRDGGDLQAVGAGDARAGARGARRARRGRGDPRAPRRGDGLAAVACAGGAAAAAGRRRGRARRRAAARRGAGGRWSRPTRRCRAGAPGGRGAARARPRATRRSGSPPRRSISRARGAPRARSAPRCARPGWPRAARSGWCCSRRRRACSTSRRRCSSARRR